MRFILLKVMAVAAIILHLSVPLSAQNNCMATNINGATINLPCNQVCQNLTFQIPHIKSTADYTVSTIPYSPFPFVTGGVELPILYADDVFSAQIPLPFTFCFYDSTYTSCVIGSNGVITFDPICANQNNAYTLSVGGSPQPIPYNGGSGPTGISTTYYPRASIMGAYHDIYPTLSAGGNRRIEYSIVGTAPCRKFVVSYFTVPMFSCTSLICTQQIVLYESTGIIEVYFQNKPLCATFNQGLAILGVQNWYRDKAVAAPGKNCTQWTESNTAYRFTPSGAGSRFVSSQIYDMSGTLIRTADTSTVTPGLLNLSFANICPPPGPTRYRIVTNFSACNTGAGTLSVSDTITVDRSNGLNATSATTDAACGPPSGSITINVPSGVGTAPYTFVLDGVVTQTGNSPMTFNNVGPGAHTVVVTDASGGCTSTLPINVALNNNLTAALSPIATSCPGVNNGIINVTPSVGTAPFTFTLNPGNIVRTGATASFTGLAAGTYTVTVSDAGGCSTTSTLTATVTNGAGLNVNTTQTATACLGGNSGSITVNPTNGLAPFTFVLDGTITQTGASTTFNNLPAGTHTITVTDAAGCTRNPAITVDVLAGPPLVTSAAHTDVLCSNGATGSITVAQPAIGNPPFQYSLDGTNWQASNVFNGLIAGTYTVYFREAGGCMGQLTKVIGQPSTLTAAASAQAATCAGQPNGVITVIPSGGVSPYEYSINGGASWQSSNTFNVVAGSHTVTIRDANQCIYSQPVTVTEPGSMMATFTTTNATCNGGNDGTISLTPTGGNTSYEFSLDANSFQSSNLFNVAPGTYTATVRDNLGCFITVPNIVVGLTNDLSFAPPATPTICEGTSTQVSITSNALQYLWSPASSVDNPNVYNPTVNPTVTTTYNVRLTYGRCTADVPVTVNVNAAPIPNAGPDGFICFGQTYQLQGSGGVEFTWTPSTYLDNTDIANPISTPAKTTTYYLSVVDANGCKSLVTDDFKLDVTPPIKVTTFPFDTVAYEGDQFQLLATSVATDYLWSPSTGLSDPNIPNPVLTAGPTGDVIVYKVVASTQAGCKGEGFVRLRVYKGPELYVPTGFTPNNDGRNDTFFPFPVGVKSIKYFRVFNRWGQMVFSTSTLNHGWDGKMAGVEQAAGVYVWMVEGVTKDDKPITKKGTIALIR